MRENLSPSPWNPLGLALRDHLAGNDQTALEVIMEDRRREPFPTTTLFRSNGFPEAEELALDLASGRVLDAGAGAGPHALELQARGLDVIALDVSVTAVDVMRQRGVRDARQGDLFTLENESFDTILLLMNGLGIAGDLDGLRRLLAHLHRLIAPGGSILADSSDLRLTDEPREQRLIEERRKAGRYLGETRLQMVYGATTGDPFPWLFVDLETLIDTAAPLGWHVQPLFEDPEGPFLVRLSGML